MGFLLKRSLLIVSLLLLLLCCSINNNPDSLKKHVILQKLPSLSERLPTQPLVIEPYSEVGKYGGELVTSWFGLDDKWTASKFSEEYLLRFDKTGTKIIENIVDSWSISKDKKIFTFHIREGMKWSDGVDFTTADIDFFWNEVLDGPYKNMLNRARWIITNDNASLSIIDDYNFIISFPQSQPNFLNNLVVEVKELFLPAHYYKKILPSFIGDSRAMEIANSLGFNDIQKYLEWVINFSFLFPDIPTLRAWIATSNPAEPVFEMGRNPFYWKVDIEGNQLPYIDKLKFINCIDGDNMVSMLSQGIINFQPFQLSKQKPFYKELISNGFNILDLNDDVMFTYTLQFNLSVSDPYLNQLFNNKKFREAISYGIDRKAFSSKKIEQASLTSENKYYSDSWNKKAVEYNPKYSIELLKSIGLIYKNGECLRADTLEPITIFLDGKKSFNKTIKLIINQLKILGIKVQYRYYSKSSLSLALNNNDIQIVLASFSPGTLLTDPTNLIPLRTKIGIFGAINIYTELKGDVKNLLELWDSLDGSKFDSYKIKGIYKLYEDNLWVVSTKASYQSNTKIIYNSSIKNLEPNLKYNDALRGPGNLSLFQLWLDK